MSLATRPALPVRIAVLGRSDLGDDGVRSLLGQDGQEARPVEQAEAVNQAGGAVAEHGRPLEAIARNGVGQSVFGGGRVGAGHPEAVGMVAVATLLGDQLGEAAGMVGRAGGVLMHGVTDAWHPGPSPSWPLVMVVIDEAHTFFHERKGTSPEVKAHNALVAELSRLFRSWSVRAATSPSR